MEGLGIGAVVSVGVGLLEGLDVDLVVGGAAIGLVVGEGVGPVKVEVLVEI